MENIYKKLEGKELTMQQISDLVKIPRATLRYRLVQYCKENNLQLPLQKAGAKRKHYSFEILEKEGEEMK